MDKEVRIAVVGGGVAGVVAAYLLSKEHRVSLFEAEPRLGGHTNTVQISSGPDTGLGVDTGFIVLNNKNYPLLHHFLAELKVPVRWSDMSFSFYEEDTGFQYAGTTLNGLFAQRENLVKPHFYRFLFELAQFCMRARRDLETMVSDLSLGEYVRIRGVSHELLARYLLPMGAAIWSAPLDGILDFPARSFLMFFKNHGLLSLSDRPRWQTVVGGSSSYLRAFEKQFSGEIRLATPIEAIHRSEAGVELQHGDGSREGFDYVVVATHADQALRLLAEPSEQEQRLLGAWRYQNNHTVLHTDTALLPSLKRAWASWNYTRFTDFDEDAAVSVSYWMNLLQGIESKTNYVVTLNGSSRIRDDKIIADFHYLHPVYSQAAVDSQTALPELSGKQRSYFCGSYFGYGFHEDAVRSAVAVAQQWDITL